MMLISDYVFYKRDNDWYSLIPWNKSFYDLYCSFVTQKIVLIGFTNSTREVNFDILHKIDSTYFDVIIVPNYREKFSISKIKKAIGVIRQECIKNKIIFLKLFYINSTIAYFLIDRKRHTIISHLVGDSELAIRLKKDLIKIKFVRMVLSKLIFYANKVILNGSDIPATVSVNLHQRYVPNNQNVIISNESWLEDWMYFDKYIAFNKIKTLKILFIGRLIPLKGIFDLLEVIKRLNENGFEIELGIVGDGILDELLKKFCISNFPQISVKFYGWIPGMTSELFNIYRNYNIFCLPSYSEGLPLVLLEALANKLIVIASNVGGIPEIIEDKKNGFLFAPGNTDQLYSIFESITQLDSNEISNIIDKGYLIAKENSFIKSRSKIPDRLKELNSILDHNIKTSVRQ